jgi:hypothetical protein
MKIFVSVVLGVAISCSSTMAMADGPRAPVPFKALMRNEAAQPGMPQQTDANAQTPATPKPPAQKTHMTSAGKIMVGAGITLVSIGGLVMAVTPDAFATPTDKNELYAASGATMGVGVLLIVFGFHRRSAH